MFGPVLDAADVLTCVKQLLCRYIGSYCCVLHDCVPECFQAKNRGARMHKKNEKWHTPPTTPQLNLRTGLPLRVGGGRVPFLLVLEPLGCKKERHYTHVVAAQGCKHSTRPRAGRIKGKEPVFLQEGQLHLAMRSKSKHCAAIGRQQLQLHSTIK
jgi:hypothetical protein